MMQEKLWTATCLNKYSSWFLHDTYKHACANTRTFSKDILHYFCFQIFGTKFIFSCSLSIHSSDSFFLYSLCYFLQVLKQNRPLLKAVMEILQIFEQRHSFISVPQKRNQKTRSIMPQRLNFATLRRIPCIPNCMCKLYTCMHNFQSLCRA